MRTVAHAALAVHHARQERTSPPLEGGHRDRQRIASEPRERDDSGIEEQSHPREGTHSRWPRRSILLPATLLLAVLGPPVAVPAASITPGDIIVANGVGGGLMLVEPLLGVFRQGEGRRSGGGRQRHV